MVYLFYRNLQNKLLQWKIENYTHIYIGIILLIIFIIILLIIRINYKNNSNNDNNYYNDIIIRHKEKFDAPTYKNLISNWDNGSGFYSELNFKLNHYLYCKKYNINFKTNSDNWPYKYNNGWTDYFQNIELNLNSDFNNNDTNLIHTESGCCINLEQFKLKDYVNIIPEYYKYTPEVEKIINNKKQELGLNNGEYGCIYIRRGDKLVNEIEFTHSDKFIDKLLNVYPDCKTIFLQTDDYNCFIDLLNYIKEKNLNIKPITLCPDTNFGAIAHSGWANQMKENTNANKEYLDKINKNLSKPISEMTLDEKYAHTIELITSVDICINSKFCICDYKSNISRFIKVAHKNVMNVFDIGEGDKFFNLESYKSIGFDF